jgi:tetratricopeptide (TPR) repeat protein
VPARPDALEVFRLALLANLRNRPGIYEQAIGPAKQFIEARPDNPLGYECVAFALERIDRKQEARAFYEKALEHKPASTELRYHYAQLLSDVGEPNEAMQILDQLKAEGTWKDLICIGMVNILGEKQGPFDRCMQLLDEALQANPRNGYLWCQKGACLLQQAGTKPNPQVAECFEKAVALGPEHGSWRGRLAHLLAQLGEIDRAEPHFRKLLEVEPNNPVVYVWLAKFLEQHRPAARQEAVDIAERALRLPAAPEGPSSREIEELIARLKSPPESSNGTAAGPVQEP